MVTANMPPFATQGTRIDVTASAMGNSKSLLGGTLLVTPLLGADGNVYAVAQGSLATGGFQAEGEAAKITRGVPTVGRLTNKIEFSLATIGKLRLALRNADFTTAKRIAIAINDYLGTPVAEPLDPSTLQLTLPPKFPQKLRGDADRDRTAPDRARRDGEDRHRRALGRSSSAATCVCPPWRWRRAI